MGGCATKPKDLDTEKAPAPVEAPAPPAEALAAIEAETVAQETKDGGETKEQPLVDVSEQVPEAKNEEVTTTEVKPASEQAVPAEDKPTEAKAEAVEQAKEPPKEDKKEVAETVVAA
ncbi:hypothetical protein Pfo_027945 [Paulownia fortunei]|nr:hypothetical protein Pfo_027945 [Paulownia fortunei]